MYYVYALLNPTKPGKYSYKSINYDRTYNFDFEPYYIGKGTNDRAYQHYLLNTDYNNLKIGKIKKLLKDYTIEQLRKDYTIIYEEMEDENYAYIVESDMINSVGCRRFNQGPLTNMDASFKGGISGCRTPEIFYGRRLYVPHLNDFITFPHNYDPYVFLKENGLGDDHFKRKFMSFVSRKRSTIKGCCFEENYEYYYKEYEIYSEVADKHFKVNRINFSDIIKEELGDFIDVSKFYCRFRDIIKGAQVFGVYLSEIKREIDNLETFEVYSLKYNKTVSVTKHNYREILIANFDNVNKDNVGGFLKILNNECLTTSECCLLKNKDKAMKDSEYNKISKQERHKIKLQKRREKYIPVPPRKFVGTQYNGIRIYSPVTKKIFIINDLISDFRENGYTYTISIGIGGTTITGNISSMLDGTCRHSYGFCLEKYYNELYKEFDIFHPEHGTKTVNIMNLKQFITEIGDLKNYPNWVKLLKGKNKSTSGWKIIST